MRDVQRDFAPDYSSIPPHGRWQHFNVGGQDRIAALLSSWGNAVDNPERCRRLLDLFLVSVLLDAGAGTSWTYKSTENGRIYRRSEGLAVASFEMFKSGLFSSNESQPHQVDADGLRRLTVEKMGEGLQVTAENPIAGLEGRTGLLIRLADALNNTQLFGADARPGNMLGTFLSSLARIPRLISTKNRLSPLPPQNPRVLHSHCSSPHPLVRFDGWPRSDLACLPHQHRQHVAR